jgi:hypothetical protein
MLQGQKMIGWSNAASPLAPVKPTTNCISIIEAICMAVQGKIDDGFCALLLYQMTAMLKAAGSDGESTAGPSLYERWRSQYFLEHGERANRHEMARHWQSILSLAPLQKHECEQVYIMAIAQMLSTSIMVYAADDTGAAKCSQSSSQAIAGLYLPITSQAVVDRRQMMCFAVSLYCNKQRLVLSEATTCEPSAGGIGRGGGSPRHQRGGLRSNSTAASKRKV